MKFGQLIECNIRNIILEKSYTKYDEETSPRPSSEKLKFAGRQEMKIFSTVFQDFGENMVGKRYFQHKKVPVITEKNNEKSGFEIIKSVFRYLDLFQKNLFFDFNTCQVFRTL